jgi:hypothetical protein
LYDQKHQHHHKHNINFDEFKQTKSSYHLQLPLTRTVSTSTDIFENETNGDNQTKNAKANGTTTNKTELNNICGIMKNSNKSKENICRNNIQNCGNNSNSRATTPKCKAKNIYYIEDTNEEDPPNIFIIDPQTLERHRRVRHMPTNKSLEDFRTHKLMSHHLRNTGNYFGEHEQENYNYDRSLYGSRTLPRDFRNHNHSNRPSLDDFFENYYSRRMSENFLDRRQNMSYPQPREMTLEDFYIPSHTHHKSSDELSSHNIPHPKNQNHPEPKYQWPKTIPKSPSSFSARSFRIHPPDDTPIVIPPPPFETNFSGAIDEFDLDKIEYERRKSHSNLFSETNKKSVEETIGTAV